MIPPQPTSPRSGPRARWFLVTLGVAQFLYLLPDILSPVSIYDEGFVVTAAERMLQGQLLYRDFIIGWAPAQFAVIAALFQFFGTSLTVERLYDIVARLLFAWVVWMVAARLTRSPLLACLPWVFATFMASPAFSFGYTVPPALGFLLLAVWFLLRYFADPQLRWTAAAGIAVGFTTLFRHDFGFYICVIGAVAMALFQWRHVLPKRAGIAPRLAQLVRWQLPFAAGVALPIVPVTAFFLAQMPAAELWYSLVALPRMNASLLALPLPGLVPDLPYTPTETSPLFYAALFLLITVPVDLPFVAAPVCAAGVWLLARRDFPGRTEVVWGLGLLLALCIPMAYYATARISVNHELPLYVLLALALTAFLRHFHGTRFYRQGSALIVLVLFLFGLNHLVFDVTPYLARTAAEAAQGFPALRSCLAASGREGCAAVPPDQMQAARYLREHTAAGERILSANPRYDQIWFQDMMIYYLTGRIPPTRNHDLLSGVATTLPVQQAVAAALHAHPVRYIAVYHGYDRWQENSLAARSSGVNYLDEVIAAHYIQVEQFGDYVILQRKEP